MNLASSTKDTRRWVAALAVGGLAAFAGAPDAKAQTRVTVAVTETIASHNPHADSVSLMYAAWCQVYGCLFHYDFDTASHISFALDEWGLKDPADPLVWSFTLKDDLKFQNGTPVTTADILHSVERIRNDPQTRQSHNARYVKDIAAVDDKTFEIVTTEPVATLPFYLANFIITSKDVFDEFGAEAADREHPVGFGPYKLKELVVDNYMVIEKVPENPLVSADNPDEIIFKIMKEPEQRVTALLNGEVQIAQFIPPQLVPRIDQAPNADVAWVDSVELMFLAMNPEFEPWGDKRVRQAVAYAINRPAIVRAILQGQASVLDGPVGPGQVGYDPDNKMGYEYNPEKAKALLAEAGYPDGVEIEYQTPVARYIADKQISEALVPMLEEVGFKVNFQTPEWGTLWANVQKGGVPFYYMGRGSVIDPSAALSQYFETGASPRILFSNETVDSLLQQERQTFDHEARMEVLGEAMAAITEEAPAHFMWRHQMAWGISKAIDYTPLPDASIFGWEIHMK